MERSLDNPQPVCVAHSDQIVFKGDSLALALPIVLAADTIVRWVEVEILDTGFADEPEVTPMRPT